MVQVHVVEMPFGTLLTCPKCGHIQEATGWSYYTEGLSDRNHTWWCTKNHERPVSEWLLSLVPEGELALW